jgi:hypothetical protein
MHDERPTPPGFELADVEGIGETGGPPPTGKPLRVLEGCEYLFRRSGYITGGSEGGHDGIRGLKSSKFPRPARGSPRIQEKVTNWKMNFTSLDFLFSSPAFWFRGCQNVTFGLHLI